MTIYFVSRHTGAQDWALRRGFAGVEIISHLKDAHIAALAPGDEVWGTLPVNVAADVVNRGAVFRHLYLPLGEAERGLNISADTMENKGAALHRYHVQRIE